MSDGDSSSIPGAVAESLKDVGTEGIKQTKNIGISFVKTAVSQITGTTKTPEEEAKEKTNQMVTHQRIQQIEAEMAQIRQHEEQKKGPQFQNSQTQQSENVSREKNQTKINEASRQAVGKAEQGRNFKG